MLFLSLPRPGTRLDLSLPPSVSFPVSSLHSQRAAAWSAEEEAQLQELYLAHKDVEGQDVVETILAHLKTRTRKQVTHHLVQMGLANSAKDFQRKGTRIVLWTEDQELELQRLFEEFRESDDVLGHIMKNITAKRSRARIVDKLLVMGLVSERRQLYKKRRKKLEPSSMSNGDESLKDSWQEDPEEEEEHSPEEESEEDEEKEEGLEAEAAQGSSFFSAEDLGQSLCREGLSAPLLWLQNCLTRAADDREEAGCSQGVPLVPLTEENEEAMENTQFQHLLRKLRMRPPISGQETFWRIPAKLSSTQLRRMAASLNQQEKEEREEERELHPGVPGEQSPSEHRAKALRALLSARKKKAGLMSPEATSEEETPGEEERKIVPRKRELLDSDEDDEGQGPAAALGTPVIHKKKRFQIEDDDED